MKEYNYKVGDIIIGIKNSIDFPDLDIVGKTGKVIAIFFDEGIYFYDLEFKEEIWSNPSYKGTKEVYTVACDGEEIRPINKIKLKHLLDKI